MAGCNYCSRRYEPSRTYPFTAILCRYFKPADRTPRIKGRVVDSNPVICADNDLTQFPGPSLCNWHKFAVAGKESFHGWRFIFGIDKAGFFDAIVHERYLEFGGEAIRKYDLIRWNLLAAKMNATTGEIIMQLKSLAENTGRYANVPRYLYWRKVGEEIEYLNSKYEPDPYTSTPTGWSRTNWREDVSRTNNQYNVGASNVHYIDAIGYFFKTGKSELFPFDQNTIASYQGQLEQNPGY